MLALLIALSLTSPQYRRFAQKNLPPPATNSCVTSILGGAFSTAAGDWHTDHSGGDPAATLTANGGAGPTGSCSSATLRFQLPGPIASYSLITINPPPDGSGSQMCSGTTSNISWGFWAKCTATRTLDMEWSDNNHGLQKATCSVTADTWTFCKKENATFWVASNAFSIGNDPLDNGGTDRGSLDCLLYAPRCVVAATISP